MSEGYPERCVLRTANEAYEGKQGPQYSPGVGAEATGSRGLWMGAVVIAPGGRTKAQRHQSVRH